MQGTPLASIQATLERHIALTQGYLPPHLPSHLPLFDPSIARTTQRNSTPEYAKLVSSLGLPTSLASDITTIITRESEQYKAFVEQARSRLLQELSTSSVAPNPSNIPTLVEAACNTFQGLLVNSGLQAIQQQLNSDLVDGTESDAGDESGSDSECSSSGVSQDEEDDGADFDQPEEDDNAPIKPGEDIPPLDTKYLPIFEALHERGKVLTKPEKTYLVNMTGMTYRQITIWFQNRRRGELKESVNASVSYSKASSTHSDDSSELSGAELEKALAGEDSSNTTFDIRSWRLKSAMAANTPNLPPSPFKPSFPTGCDASDAHSDDTDLSDDSDEDPDLPPGLQAPSLTMSLTTVDSMSAHGSFLGPLIVPQPDSTRPGKPGYPRPIKNLPVPRRTTPPTSSRDMQEQLPSAFRSDTAGQSSLTGSAASVSQVVTSNERGLTVDLGTTPPMQASTLRSSPTDTPSELISLPLSVPSTASPSSSISAESPRRRLSPTPPRRSTSPRPHTKPLPVRRTGCAPRPRPPPRASSISASTPGATPTTGASWSPVVLPPSSNPSLSNTTLGSLLRPNQPAPTIPTEIEERLTAMAGRMGVTTGSSSNPVQRHGTSPNVPVPRIGAPGTNKLVGRGTPFSFGPTSLPTTASAQLSASPRDPTAPRR